MSKRIISVTNLKETKDGALQFTVVLRTSLGLWYERGWRVLKNGKVVAPGRVFGKNYYAITKPPKLAKKAIRNKILRKMKIRENGGTVESTQTNKVGGV